MPADRSRVRPTGELLLSWLSRRASLDVGDQSRPELGQPAHGPESRSEAVLAAPGDDEGGKVLQPPSDRAVRDREAPGAVVSTHQRVLLERGTDEYSVVEPLRLHELELTLDVCAREDEDDSSVDAVVLEHTLGQHGSVARPAADHPMQSDIHAAVVVEGVPRVRASGVCPQGAFEAPRIVAVEEGVVALRVAAQILVIALWGERQRRTALPTADHLRPEQLCLRPTGGVGGDVLTVGRHPRVQLAEHDVGAVAAEHVRGGHRRQLARLIRIAEDHLSRLEWSLLGVRARSATAFDGRLTDAVLEAEGGSPAGELVAVLPPDELDALKVPSGMDSPVDDRLVPPGVRREYSHGDVDVGGTQWLLPVVGAAVSDVTELRGTCRHPFPELRGEALQ